MRKTRFRVTVSVVQSHILEEAGGGLGSTDCHNLEPLMFSPWPKLVPWSHCFLAKPLGPFTPLVDTGPLHMLFVGSPSSPFLLCLATSYYPLKTNSDITCPTGKIVSLSALGFQYTPFMPQTHSPRGSVRTSVCKSVFLLDCQCIQD